VKLGVLGLRVGGLFVGLEGGVKSAGFRVFGLGLRVSGFSG
jgi:hypothetical protein